MHLINYFILFFQSLGSYVNVLKYLDFINSTVASGECWYKVDQNATVKVLQQALETAQAIAEKIAENGTLNEITNG